MHFLLAGVYFIQWKHLLKTAGTSVNVFKIIHLLGFICYINSEVTIFRLLCVCVCVCVVWSVWHCCSYSKSSVLFLLLLLLFLLLLLNSTVTIRDYMSLNGRVIDKWWIKNEFQLRSHVLTVVLFWHLPQCWITHVDLYTINWGYFT